MFSKRLMKRLKGMTAVYARLDQQGWLKGSDLLQEVLVQLIRLSQGVEVNDAQVMDLAKKRMIDALRATARIPQQEKLPGDEDGDAWIMAVPGPNLDLQIDFTRAMNALTPEERLLLPLMEFSQREQARLTRIPRYELVLLHRSIREKLRRAGLCAYLQGGKGSAAAEPD